MNLNRKSSEVARLFTDLYNAGFSDEEIGRELGYTVGTVKVYRQKYKLMRPGRYYTKEQHEQMIDMWHEGLNVSQIARVLNCHRRTVEYWIAKEKEKEVSNDTV